MQAALFVVAHVRVGAGPGRAGDLDAGRLRLALGIGLVAATLDAAGIGACRAQPIPGAPAREAAACERIFPPRWEGDGVRLPLGQMERLLNARRSWSGAMTTAHVSAAILGDDDGARERGDP